MEKQKAHELIGLTQRLGRLEVSNIYQVETLLAL